jgi:hypothetical protein
MQELASAHCLCVGARFPELGVLGLAEFKVVEFGVPAPVGGGGVGFFWTVTPGRHR